MGRAGATWGWVVVVVVAAVGVGSEQVAATVPVGGVVDWWKPNGTYPLPAGFQVCDGSRVEVHDSPLYGAVLPDLRGMFVLGVDESAIGEVGGSAQATTSQDGTHTHTISASSECGNICGSAHKCGGTACYANPMNTLDSTTTGSAGDHTHTVDVLPPYVGLLKLIRVV